MKRVQTLCWCLFLLVLCCTVKGADLAAKCTQMVEKVIPCLNFVTGQAEVPTKDCCDASTKMKETNPECLCYIIQQTHKGSPEVKSFGIQEARLLRLPTACNLKNASITHCPKLLGLSPTSPDAAIFTNASLKTAPTSSGGTTPPNSENQKVSNGNILRPALMADIMIVGWAILLFVIPTGIVSIYTG